jgi:ABC-type multidrug transport system fused ATPase/permease subunit
MPYFIRNASDLIRRVLFLARPYGRKKLALVFFLSLAQGIFQVIGVTSIFPFLAIASDPERIRHSQFGLRFLALLPPLGNRELLITTGVIAIVGLLLSNVFNLLAEYTRARYANNFAHWLRVRILRRMASQPYGYFLQRNSGDLLRKVMSDVGHYTGGVLLPLLDSIARAIIAALLLATLFLVQPVIALSAALGFSAFYLIIFRLLARKRQEISEGLRTAFAVRSATPSRCSAESSLLKSIGPRNTFWAASPASPPLCHRCLPGCRLGRWRRLPETKWNMPPAPSPKRVTDKTKGVVIH